MVTDLERNIKTVKDLFSALSQGDIPTVLNYLDNAIDWQSPATKTTLKEISWSKERRGCDQVKAFFSELRDKIRMDDMSYSSIVATDDRVVIEGTTRGSVISTGCFYRSDWVMAFTLRNGKIIRFRHYYDSADVAAAFHAAGDICKAFLKAA